MKLTRKIELTAEENELLRSALYYAICEMESIRDDYQGPISEPYYNKVCANIEGFTRLINRLYPHMLGGEADDWFCNYPP